MSGQHQADPVPLLLQHHPPGLFQGGGDVAVAFQRGQMLAGVKIALFAHIDGDHLVAIRVQRPDGLHGGDH